MYEGEVPHKIWGGGGRDSVVLKALHQVHSSGPGLRVSIPCVLTKILTPIISHVLHEHSFKPLPCRAQGWAGRAEVLMPTLKIMGLKLWKLT